jgi:uncharacterized YccA/Bax inhibitor family protein
METSNPSVKKGTFDFPATAFAEGRITLSGAINKSGLLLIILVAAAAFAWTTPNPAFAMVGGILGFITALGVIFKPNWAPTLAPLYAVFEGLALGTISVMMEAAYPGIATNAMALTLATLALMLGCYRLGLLRATPMFQRVAVLATGAIAITYIVDMILGFFGHSVQMIHEGSPIGIAFSVIVVGVAAMNLILDFNMFEQNATRSPKYMEWYCGFALMMTLVWLYLEMLRLLSKFSRR